MSGLIAPYPYDDDGEDYNPNLDKLVAVVQGRSPRDYAKQLAFGLINANQSKIDALIDAIVDAAKDEIHKELIK